MDGHVKTLVTVARDSLNVALDALGGVSVMDKTRLGIRGYDIFTEGRIRNIINNLNTTLKNSSGTKSKPEEESNGLS